MSKSFQTSEADAVEIKLHKDDFDTDSPDFPKTFEVTTLEKLIGDIKQFLECEDPIAGIVFFSDSNVMTVISKPKHLPSEAVVGRIIKKSRSYFKMTVC